MPFSIVRNDILKMDTNAIVNITITDLLMDSGGSSSWKYRTYSHNKRQD